MPSSHIDLSLYASSCLTNAAYDMNVLNIETLREAASDFAAYEADSACSYTHVCRDIIERYENDPVAADSDDMGAAGVTAPSDWRKLMTQHAYNVAYCVISDMVQGYVNELEAASDSLCTAIGALLEAKTPDTVVSEDDITLSSTDPFAWAACTRIDESGVMLFTSGQLDGMNGACITSGPLTLSMMWAAA